MSPRRPPAGRGGRPRSAPGSPGGRNWPASGPSLRVLAWTSPRRSAADCPTGGSSSIPACSPRISHDEAEWAPVGRAVAGVRARTEAEVRHVVRTCAEFGAPVVPRGAGTGLSGGANATDGAVMLDLSRMNQVLEIDAGQHDLRRAARRGEQRPEGGRGRPRPVVPARPGKRALVDDRRQRRHQRRGPVLPEVRRHPRLRARAARGHRRGRAAGRLRRRGHGSAGGPAKAWPGST